MTKISPSVDIDKVERQAAERIAVFSTPEAIWTTDICASFLGMSTRYFAEKVSKHPSFPAPLIFPTDGVKPILKWRAIDVKEWANLSKK